MLALSFLYVPQVARQDGKKKGHVGILILTYQLFRAQMDHREGAESLDQLRIQVLKVHERMRSVLPASEETFASRSISKIKPFVITQMHRLSLRFKAHIT